MAILPAKKIHKVISQVSIKLVAKPDKVGLVIINIMEKDEGYFVGRSMDVFISRLRKLLKDEPAVNIHTIHGIGYKLDVTCG